MKKQQDSALFPVNSVGLFILDWVIPGRRGPGGDDGVTMIWGATCRIFAGGVGVGTMVGGVREASALTNFLTGEGRDISMIWSLRSLFL